MERTSVPHKLRWVLLLVVALVIGGASAYAVVPPRSNAAIDACFNANRGTLRVLVDETDRCNDRETAIQLLGALATAANAQLLDGKDSTEFLAATAKASDADRLDGIDSTGFVKTGTALSSVTYIVTVTTEGTVVGSLRVASVSCDEGDLLLSGGLASVDQGTQVLDNHPESATTWRATWLNDATVDSLQIRALCADQGGDRVPPAAAVACADGLDNDGDGLIDSADPGCSSAADTSEIGSTQCDDDIDNDGDGTKDFRLAGGDPQCTSPADTSESDAAAAATACADGVDNDLDGLVDTADPGCSGPEDTSERGSLACDDGIDNDGDGGIDFKVGGSSGVPGDLQCTSPVDGSESF